MVRAYDEHAIYDCVRLDLNYTWDRERNRWLSDAGGQYGEPLTLPVSRGAGSPGTPTCYLHQIVRLADPPARCSRCDTILQAGADCWRAGQRERELGVFCHGCARPPVWWDSGPPPPTRPHRSSGARSAKPIEETAGSCDDGTSWVSPDDPLFEANHYVHEVVSLADSPLPCARCDAILEPGTDSWHAYHGERDYGVVCRHCGENYGLNGPA